MPAVASRIERSSHRDAYGHALRSIAAVVSALLLVVLAGCAEVHDRDECHALDIPCPDGFVCGLRRSTWTWECTPQCPRYVHAGEACDAESSCVYAGICRRYGSQIAGEPCDGDTLLCAEDLACSDQYAGIGEVCAESCVGDRFDDSECALGTLCTRFSVCVPPCDPAVADTCPFGSVCRYNECDPNARWCNDAARTRCPPNEICETATLDCLTPLEFDARHPRPPGGRCHELGGCPP